METLPKLNGIFLERKGFFGQPYKSIRLHDREITLDSLKKEYKFRVCVCTSYKESRDRKRKKLGVGAGEVLEEHYFSSEDEAKKFIYYELLL